MRISDWSSDVCSSDLEQILLGNKDARATVIEDIGDLGRREMPVYRHGISADMLGAEHRLDKGDSIGEKDRDAAAGANARRGEQRSEEHTSELQSLMRNSYAVFCLKKKNTQTKITQTI